MNVGCKTHSDLAATPGLGGEWGPWSPCSVPCGSGYRNRTRGGGLPGLLDFSSCGLQPCAGEGGTHLLHCASALRNHPTLLTPPCHPRYPSEFPCSPVTSLAPPRASASPGLGAPGRVKCAGAGLPISVFPGPVPGMCPGGKRWLDCAQGPASCAELSAPPGINQTCHPGCYCPSGTLLLVS